MKQWQKIEVSDGYTDIYTLDESGYQRIKSICNSNGKIYNYAMPITPNFGSISDFAKEKGYELITA